MRWNPYLAQLLGPGAKTLWLHMSWVLGGEPDIIIFINGYSFKLYNQNTLYKILEKLILKR